MRKTIFDGLGNVPIILPAGQQFPLEQETYKSAKIDLPFELPAYSPNDQIVKNIVYTFKYNETYYSPVII